MNRRGFLRGILAAGVAPAVIPAASLMRVVSPTGIIAPVWGLSGITTGRFSSSSPAILELPKEIAAGSRNLLLPIDQITKEALRIMHEQAQFLDTCNPRYAELFDIPRSPPHNTISRRTLRQAEARQIRATIERNHRNGKRNDL